MNKYKVFFEIYGKKMCTTVDAYSKSDAESSVIDSIIFHETRLIEGSEDIHNSSDDIAVEDLMKVFGIKK